MANLSSRLSILISLTLLVGCDHATKGIAKVELDGGTVHHLIDGILGLRYVENTDIAFNLLRWVPETVRAPALLVFGSIAVVVLGILLLRGFGDTLTRRCALVLVTAGALGNYLDRVVRGYVVDFVHLRHWPVFNVADVYITAGYVLLALDFFLSRRHPAATRRHSG